MNAHYTDANRFCQLIIVESPGLPGISQTVKVAYFRLTYSRRMFVVAYPRETQEMVLDAHIKALNNSEAFSSDNLKTAVDSIFVGKERQAGYDSTS